MKGLEAQLQAKIIKDLQGRGWFVVKIIACNRPGYPDLQAEREFRGRHIMVRIECKAPGQKPTPLQEYVHEQIRNHGGVVHVVDTWETYLKLEL